MGACSSKTESPRPGVPRLQKTRTFKFQSIADNFNNLENVQDALRREGLESSNLIVAVDFTKSNEWTGKVSFGGKCLHDVGPVPNPYEQAIGIIGKTLAAFDDDSLIPCYGFGDVRTKDNAVFSFLPNDAPIKGLETVVWRYRELVPNVKLAGPTSFAAAINHAVRVVVDSGMQYHILVLIADGQVTRGSDLTPSELSPQEYATIKAIEAASQFPLSIVMVGVGDGPWDVMKEFDDKLPDRAFDNFQFVNFTELGSQGNMDQGKREALFALRALMEIPEQYKAIQNLGLLGGQPRYRPNSRALDPPGPPTVVCQSPTAQAARECTSSASMFKTPDPMPYASPFPTGSVKKSGGVANEVIDPIFICPITQEVMVDPVIAADGNCYERSAIEQWFMNKDTSPMTNQRLDNKTLIPNHQLRSAILEANQRQSRNGV